MNIKYFFAACVCAVALNAQAQNETWGYEYENDIPVYYEMMHADLTYPMAWGNSKIKNFKKWKKAARAKVFECMLTPPPPPKSYDVEVLAEEQRDGYRAQRIAFNLSSYYRVKAYLLIPDGEGRHPAVNLLHDHGAHLSIGKEKMIRPFAVDSAVINDALQWADNLYDGRFMGDELAKRGYVVISTDAPLWAERGRKEGVARNLYDIIAGNMMMFGRDLSAFMTYDDIAATDFLASLPCVDDQRIGCAGCSMGGYRSWMLAALSDKISVGCVTCWMVTSDVQLSTKYGRRENGGFANCIPGLRLYLDYPHIASLACPKPMLFIAGRTDKLFPLPGVEKAFDIMHQVWKSQGADDRLQTVVLDHPHGCPLIDQQMMFDFFDKYLKK